MDEKMLIPGVRVKIIGGAPHRGGVFMEDVGKEGVIVTITDMGWGNKKLGKYGYEVIPDGCIFGFFIQNQPWRYWKMTSKTEKPKFKMGQRVKIVRGAPATYMTILDDVGKKGRITDILISGENDIGWHDETLGKYAYRVLPDDRDDPALALYYPESSLI